MILVLYSLPGYVFFTLYKRTNKVLFSTRSRAYTCTADVRISRNVPYIGGHLAIFFKSNFTQAYCVLKVILSIICMFHSVYVTHRETKIKTKEFLPLDNLFIKE